MNPNGGNPAVSALPTRQQYMSALDRANVVRCARADIKRDIAADPTFNTIIELVADPPAVAYGMKVLDALCALRGVGMFKAREYLRHAGVERFCSLGALTDRERAALVGELRYVQIRRRAL